jgi:hypothetical protein
LIVFYFFFYQWIFLWGINANAPNPRTSVPAGLLIGQTAYYSTEDGARTAGLPTQKYLFNYFHRKITMSAVALAEEEAHKNAPVRTISATEDFY